MMHLPHKNQGLGLIELMLTVLLMSGGVLALVRFQNYMAYNNSIAIQQGTAEQLALNQIETLRDYTALTGSNSYANISSGSQTYTGTGASYTITRTVTPYTNPTYKKIDVIVSWTDRYGNAQSQRLISNIVSLDPIFSSTIMAI